MPNHGVGRSVASCARTGRVLLLAAFLTACGGGSGDDGNSGALTDADATADQIDESARPGAPVGLTVSAPDVPNGTAAYSLADNAGGAFVIDPVTGVVTLAGAVDYEAAPSRTIVAAADFTVAGRQRHITRQFTIAVLDSPEPQFVVAFPFSHARFSDGAISVSATVKHPHPENITISAEAGGTPVQSQVVDGRFSINNIGIVGQGQFTLRVTASHPGGESTTLSMPLSREPELAYVPRMVLDPTRARVLLVDRDASAIIASPLDGGPRTIVSGGPVGSGPAFSKPVALTLDPQGDTLYVADDELNAIFRVDVATGDRVVLPASGASFFTPTELDFDTTRGQLILADESNGILTVDPSTGERRMLSTSQSPGPRAFFYRGVGYDSARDRIILSDSSSFFAVDPLTGARSMLSDWNNDLVPRFFRGMSVASEGGVLYVGEEYTNGVVRIDLTTGTRTQVTASGLPPPYNVPGLGAGPDLQYPEDVAFNPADNRLFLIEADYASPLIEVLPNGDRVKVRDASLGSGLHFRGPSGIKFNATTRALDVADYVGDAIAEIDNVQGDRTLIAGRADGRGSIDSDPMDVAYRASTGEYYIVDFTANSLYAVRRGETQPRIVADANTGSGPALNNPNRIEIDDENGIAYVADYDLVMSVDLATGARQVIVSGLTYLTGLAADFANRRIYVAQGSGSVYRIDLASGAPQAIALGFPVGFTAGLAFDSEKSRLIVAKSYPVGLEAIDVATGTRTPIPAASNCGPKLVAPQGIAVQAERQVAYVTDGAYKAVIAVDLTSGCRQLIAK